MTRYWQFAVVGIICLLVALLWAQPARSRVERPSTQASMHSVDQNTAAGPGHPSPPPPPDPSHPDNTSDNDDQPLPGSSSSLPLLAVIGFGVLAGGITSAMRTRP